MIGYYQDGIIIANNSSLLSIYVISLVDVAKWREGQLQMREEKVESYDLLDLNDTVVKLKSNENLFMY